MKLLKQEGVKSFKHGAFEISFYDLAASPERKPDMVEVPIRGPSMWDGPLGEVLRMAREEEEHEERKASGEDIDEDNFAHTGYAPGDLIGAMRGPSLDE